MLCNVLHSFAVCRSKLQRVAVWCCTIQTNPCIHTHTCMCCSSMLQCLALCCSVFQCVAVSLRKPSPTHPYRKVLQCIALGCTVLPCVALCCSVLQCLFKKILTHNHTGVCCNVLQCVAVCCIVLQCFAVWCNTIQQTSASTRIQGSRWQMVQQQLAALTRAPLAASFRWQPVQVALRGSVLQYVAVWCSVLQCVTAVRCPD